MEKTFMRRTIRAGAGFAAVMSQSAYAHTGLGEGALAGILHPLLGWDHVLTMLAVGAWSARLTGGMRWLMPAVFVVVLAISAQFSLNGVFVPILEAGIALSLLVAGLLIGARAQVCTVAGAVIVSMFAVFHGLAHSAEMPMLVSPWLFTLGFSVSTVLLQCLGLAIGHALCRTKAGMPIAGVLLFGSGSYGMATIF